MAATGTFQGLKFVLADFRRAVSTRLPRWAPHFSAEGIQHRGTRHDRIKKKGATRRGSERMAHSGFTFCTPMCLVFAALLALAGGGAPTSVIPAAAADLASTSSGHEGSTAPAPRRSPAMRQRYQPGRDRQHLINVIATVPMAVVMPTAMPRRSLTPPVEAISTSMS